MTPKPRKMLIGSILMMIGAVIGGGLTFFDGAGKLAEFGRALESSESVEMPGTTIRRGTGQPLSIWATGTSFLRCSTRDNDGPVTMTPVDPQSTEDTTGTDHNLIGLFPTTSGETYTVTCEGADGATFSLVQFPIGTVLSGALLTLIGAVGGFIVFVLGVIFLVISLVRRANWKKRNGVRIPPRRTRRPGQPGQPGPPAGGPSADPGGQRDTGWEHLVVPGSPALPGYPAPPNLIGEPPAQPPPLPPPVEQGAGSVR